jgi:hypothetical protein
LPGPGYFLGAGAGLYGVSALGMVVFRRSWRRRGIGVDGGARSAPSGGGRGRKGGAGGKRGKPRALGGPRCPPALLAGFLVPQARCCIRAVPRGSAAPCAPSAVTRHWFCFAPSSVMGTDSTPPLFSCCGSASLPPLLLLRRRNGPDASTQAGGGAGPGIAASNARTGSLGIVQLICGRYTGDRNFLAKARSVQCNDNAC